VFNSINLRSKRRQRAVCCQVRRLHEGHRERRGGGRRFTCHERALEVECVVAKFVASIFAEHTDQGHPQAGKQTRLQPQQLLLLPEIPASSRYHPK